MLLGVTEITQELGINLLVSSSTKQPHSLHATSTLTLGLLDSVLVVLDALVTSGMMLLLHHSTAWSPSILLAPHVSYRKTSLFQPVCTNALPFL